MDCSLRIRQQGGQAMVFGLLFMAVVVMTLLILFNQGQLVKNRVQIENAADAAVYSQAKLAARNQNFIAYTNRAMVANEVSVGQMVALLSWAKHYKQVGAFTNYPLYNFPVAPPSPVTFSQVLTVVTLPWKIMGTVIEAPTKVMVDKWPTVISYFNGALGLFQKIFALSTLEAQVEINLNVVEDHEFDPDNPELYTPVIGWFFFTQNALLTYYGENFNISNLVSLVNAVPTDGAPPGDLVEDYFAGQGGQLSNMLNSNTPKTSGGSTAVDAYQRYAAIVNRNREAFTKDRHWDVGLGESFHFPIVLDAGIVKLTIELDLGFWAGIKNDGGAAFVTKDKNFDTNAAIGKLGWSAIDVTSFGIEFNIGLFVNIEVCLPWPIGCHDWTLIDVDFTIPLGFPLAGATHQVVSDTTQAKKIFTDWGYPGMDDPGKYGESFDLFHAQTLMWGQVAPQLQPGGMYGTRANIDVTDSYGGPPSFFSLSDHFQERGKSYEFTIALAKSLDDVETSDHDSIGVDSGSTDWESGDVSYTKFDVQTKSRTEGSDVASFYQRTIWNDDRPMMTVSSAETYFRNPMQSNSDGSREPANLFSPFWDARLREPSAVALLLATGEVDWEDVFDGMPSTTIALVEWLLNKIGDEMVEAGTDYLIGQIDPPFDSLMEDPIKDAASAAKDVAVQKVVGELEEFIP